MQEQSNYVVKENPALIRMLATRHMRSMYSKYIGGFLFFYILYEIIPNMLGLVFPDAYTMQVPTEYVGQDIAGQVPSVPFVYMFYIIALGGALVLGRTLFLMTALRNRDAGADIIVEGMPFYFKATFIYLAQMIMFTIGLVCFIVPGVILFYLYSQAMYVFADDPNKSVIECLRASREMMRGNIFNMIKLDLLYLPLIVIGYAPTAIFIYYGLADVTTFAGMLVYFICRFTLYVAMGNLFMGRVTFYELMVCRGFQNFKYAGEKDFREFLREQR